MLEIFGDVHKHVLFCFLSKLVLNRRKPGMVELCHLCFDFCLGPSNPMFVVVVYSLVRSFVFENVPECGP